MLNKLQQKWKVNGWRLLLILITFAVGGSLCGLIGRKLMMLTGIERTWVYIPIYIIVVTLLWPFMVLLVSIPLGQFRFFVEYLRNMGRRIRNRKTQKPMNRERLK